jgi:hypothetical protein
MCAGAPCRKVVGMVGGGQGGGEAMRAGGPWQKVVVMVVVGGEIHTSTMSENGGGVVCEGIGGNSWGHCQGSSLHVAPSSMRGSRATSTAIASSRREESLEAPVTNAPPGLGCCPTIRRQPARPHFGVHQLGVGIVRINRVVLAPIVRRRLC